VVQFAETWERSLPAGSAVGKCGRDGHGCCRLGMWKEYAG